MAIVKPPSVPVPQPPGKPGGLGEKLENTLRRFAALLLNDAREALAGILRFGLETFLEAIEPLLIKYTKPLLTEIRDQPGVPDSFKYMISEVLSGQDQAAATLLAGLGTQAAGSVMGSVLNTMLAPLTYAMNRKVKPWRFDPSAAWRLRRVGTGYGDIADVDLQDAGLDVSRRQALDSVFETRLGVADWLRYYYLTGLSYDELKKQLHRVGFDTNQIDVLLKVSEGLPGLSDIVRMAVREAWNDPVASRFGYDADFPTEFGDWCKRLGYSADWAKRFWRAHWELPSPSMGFEMFQRGIISQTELSDLLRALDIPQFWRDKLTRLAYNPITRVDVRRMWQTGHIKTIDELIKRYKDVGYSPEDAAALAAWTVQEYTSEERKATKTEILKAYKLGRLGRAQAKQALIDLEIQDFYADIYLDEIDLSKANELVDEQVGLIRSQYIAGMIDRNSAVTALGRLNLPASEIETYLNLWTIQREARIKRPTKTELRSMFLENVIDESTYRRELSFLGLSTLYIDWYVYQSKLAKEKAALQELESRRVEEEKLRLARIKERYEIEIAQLNKEAATIKLAICELELSVTDETTDEELSEIAQLIENMKKRLREIDVEKATARVTELVEKEGGA